MFNTAMCTGAMLRDEKCHREPWEIFLGQLDFKINKCYCIPQGGHFPIDTLYIYIIIFLN